MVKLQLLVNPNMHAKSLPIKKIKFSCQNGQFLKGSTEMGHFDMKISIFFKLANIWDAYRRWLKIKFNYGTSINIGQMKLKNLILLVVMLVLNKMRSNFFE